MGSLCLATRLFAQGAAGPDLIGRPAIFDIPVGKGHVVAFNFNPLHRDLNRGDQRMLWNAIVNWRKILAPPAADRSHPAAAAN
jgi:hypothetical protein